MKLDLLHAQELPARTIYDFKDAQGHTRTLIVHPNKHVSIWTESSSIRFDAELSKQFIALLEQFVDTGDVDPATLESMDEGSAVTQAEKSTVLSLHGTRRP